MQDPNNRQKSPSGHHRTPLSDYIFATKAHIDNQKKSLLKSNISPTCAHYMLNIGPLVAVICWRVWGNPANFNGFHVLAALQCDTGSRRQPNFAALNRGRHLYSAGPPFPQIDIIRAVVIVCCTVQCTHI